MTTTAAHFLPAYDVCEHHERMVATPPERALELALGIPVCPDRIVRTLFALRRLDVSAGTLESFFSTGDFVVLERTSVAYVFGVALRLRGRPRSASSADDWRTWGAPGILIAGDFVATPDGAGRTRLSTQTRVLALDARSRVAFRIYWLAIGPFSALIRRRWLAAIAAAAEVRPGPEEN